MDTSDASKVYITTLGKFEIRIGSSVISDEINRANRMWNFLSYIIMHRKRSISHTEIIEAIWPDEDSDNPINTLKTLVYRVRIMLADFLGSEHQLIISRSGSYAWNSDYDCIVDAEEFDRMCQLAESPTLSRSESMEHFSAAVELYQGDFLPKLSDEMWVIPMVMHYRNLYLDTAKKYAEMLLADGKFIRAGEVCKMAIGIDQYDEDIHALLVRTYACQGNEAAALAHYDKATDMLYRNLSVLPSEKLRKAYLDIMARHRRFETDLSLVKQELNEAEHESGAFVCDYGFFREAYRLEARRVVRYGTCSHVSLITFTARDGQTPQLEALGASMADFISVIKKELRQGDVISRYSGAQVIVLLPTSNYENGVMVMERIASAFQKEFPRSGFGITYKLQQLDCAI